MNCLNEGERRLLAGLRGPDRIQHFLDTRVRYNKEVEGRSCRSPRRVLRDGLGHCMEGALLAAAALRVQGYPPLLVDLEAVRDDDHVLAVFQRGKLWGAIAKSNYSGLRFREPVYRTIRELALSYFEHYFNEDGEKTLRAFSRPANLSRFDRIEWMTSEEDLWPITYYLAGLPHVRLFPPTVARRLNPVDERLQAAGRLGRQ